MKTKFTPAPWTMNTTKKWLHLKGEEGLCITGGDNSRLVAVVSHDLTVLQLDEYIANAKLVAAAPKLYEALKDLIEETKGQFEASDEGTDNNIYKRAEAALKSATE